MNCPIDGNELAGRIYEADIHVDECPVCHGIWLDEGELEDIQETKENDYSEELARIPDYVAGARNLFLAGSESERLCPVCSTAMEKREYGYCSQVMIDVCPSCRGIWLDHGEVRALEVFFEKAQSNTHKLRKGFFAGLRSLFDRNEEKE